MIKNILNFKVILLLALFTGFMSCENDNIGLNDELSENIELNDVDLVDLTEDIAEINFEEESQMTPGQFFKGKGDRCFTPVFPITMVFPDGSTQEFQNREEMGNALKTWKQENPGVNERPEFQFPITVTLKDGTTKTFDNKEDFGSFVKRCRGDNPRGHKPNKCFTPVFPLTIVFPDGTEEQVDDQEALRTAMMEWKQNNPSVDGHPEFKFPFDVTLKNGDVVTVNNKEDLRAISKRCRGDRNNKPHINKCFKVVFPITIKFPDGSTIEIDSKENLKTEIVTWMQNNPDVDGRPHIVFPFDVEKEDGTIITINSKEDLIKLMRKCRGKRKGGKGGRGHGNG